MPMKLGQSAWNKMNRVGNVYGKLTVLCRGEPGKWKCKCTCGNVVEVLSTNLANYAKNNRGCKHCGHRKNITGERRGLLVAESPEPGVVTGRPPLWSFVCDCGGMIQATVREFRANLIRSCGCHDNVHGSWASMMSRCYDPKDVRYPSYGGRGIRVETRWHDFENFVQDMGERPKRYNLGRKHAEKSYGPSNCKWEHISQNCRDTKNDGQPTRPGLKKGARSRR